MKLEKINQEVIKDYCKNGLYQMPSKLNFAECEDLTGVIANNGTMAYILRPDEVVFNKSVIYGSKKPLNLANIITPAEDATEILMTGKSRSLIGDKRLFIEYINEKDELIYFDSNLLKNFEDFKIKQGSKAKGPAYIFENKRLVGLVMPFKMNN